MILHGTLILQGDGMIMNDGDHQIRFVCLSDLHLGDKNSILNQNKGDRFEESDVMKNLARCLEGLLINKDSGKVKQPRPILIMNGDIMDLALGNVEDSSMMFERFMNLAMSNRRELFDRVIFIPGNHDHHIWETARETQYENYILRKNLPVLPAPWHRTGMVLDQEPTYSSFLTSLIKRHTIMRVGGNHNYHTLRGTHAPFHRTGLKSPMEPRTTKSENQSSIKLENKQRYNTVRREHLFRTGLKIQVSYPNLAIPSEDNTRCAIIHHGHFTESPYYLMSQLNNLITGEFPDNIDALEKENFAWIDFLWSVLGRSGAPGGTVGNIYKYIKNPQMIDRFFDEISANIAKKCDVPYLPGTWIEEKAIRKFFKICYPFITNLPGERIRRDTISNGDNLMSDGVKIGLNQFLRLSWPLMKNDLPQCIRDITLVYGHTHKPFERMVDLDKIESGINKSIAVYNTGGWVVDQTEIHTDFGASIVLMDSNLNLVSLQVYREGGLDNVLIRSTNDNSEFYGHVKGKIEGSPDHWNELVNSVNKEYETKLKSLKD